MGQRTECHSSMERGAEKKGVKLLTGSGCGERRGLVSGGSRGA